MNIAAVLSVIFLLTGFCINAQEVDGLICKDGDKSVRLGFETLQPYLEVCKTTMIKVYVENIDLKASAIIGAGIRVKSGDNKTYFLCSVDLQEKFVVDEMYKIIFKYDHKEGKSKVCTFQIPVKL